MTVTYRCCLIIAGFLISECGSPATVRCQSLELIRPEIVVSQRAIDLHRASPVVDGHNDLPWALREAGGSFDRFDIRTHQSKFHTDLPRLATGGVGAQFWSVYVPADTSSRGNALAATLEQIAIVKEMSHRYSDSMELATSTADIARIRDEGKIACLIGVEGGPLHRRINQCFATVVSRGSSLHDAYPFDVARLG